MREENYHDKQQAKKQAFLNNTAKNPTQKTLY